MSRHGLVNPSVARGTTAGWPSGATNFNQKLEKSKCTKV